MYDPNKINHQVALTDEALLRFAPAIFAPSAHESRSARYGYIPTAEIVAGMRNAGFLPVTVKQSASRDEGKKGHAKHMIRFRRLDMTLARGDIFPEVALVNSHDGSSAYTLHGALYRVLCCNGLVVEDSLIESVKIAHTKRAIEQVIEGSFRVIEQSAKALVTADRWSQIQLTAPEQNAFAEAAHVLRFADDEGNVATPIQPGQLLRTRRFGDQKPDLWTTFNVVQENVIQGGLRGRRIDPTTGRSRRVSTRAIGGIDQDVKLNKALWVLASKMAEVKGG